MNHALYVTSVWLHLLGAMTWIGGMLFLVLVLVPALRRMEDKALAVALIQQTGRRFRLVGWICLGLLGTTGWLNLVARGWGWATLRTEAFWATPFGGLLAVKFGTFSLILVLSAWHDFRIGPRATAALRARPGSPEAVRLRALASWFGRLNLLLALVMAAAGVMLVRGRPW
jgi:copper resistance protein D